MPNFAQLDKDNKITDIICVADRDCLDNLGNFSEEVGENFCKNLLRTENKWKKVNEESIGSVYDENLDKFIPPKPHSSWTWDTENLKWIPPIPKPNLTEEEIKSQILYQWDENNQNWKLFSSEQ